MNEFELLGETLVITITSFFTLIILALVFCQTIRSAPRSMIFIIAMYGVCITSRITIVFANFDQQMVGIILIRALSSCVIEMVLQIFIF